MASTPERPKWQQNPLSTFNVLIESLSLAKEKSSITPASTAFGEVCALLANIGVRSSKLSRRRASGSRLCRTPWPTNGIAYMSDYYALMYVDPSTEG